MRVAITREVSQSFELCELTHLERQLIDVGAARKQHRMYEIWLEELGCRVLRIPAEPDLPDAVFVEDIAIVLDEVAVIGRPGVESRMPEINTVAKALEEFRTLRRIEPPGTLEGGDVLKLGRSLYVGRSSRSNESGIQQLKALVEPFEYSVRAVDLEGSLHLKSAVTQVKREMVLINPAWVQGSDFEGMQVVEVHPGEPLGANALLVGDAVLYPSAYSHTRQRLEAHGITVRCVDVSELAKAEGGVTCCSLIFM